MIRLGTSPPWEDEAIRAAEGAGWRVVGVNGADDYQGGGTLLLEQGTCWAVLQWTYGTCEHCDQYLNRPTAEVVQEMKGLIDELDESHARAKFQESQW